MATGPQSNLSAPAGFSSSDLVFNDNFSGTTLDKDWHPYITSNSAGGTAWNSNGSGGSSEGGPYIANYDTASQVTVNNGLTLDAVQKSIQGTNQGAAETFPVNSGAVSSYGAFEFTGGYLQISMKQPSGSGTWPALWMLPGKGAGSSGDNYEIDMQEGGFTNGSNPNDNVGWHLHTSSGTFGGVSNVGTDLSSGFNTYGVDWVPGKSITWFLNGKEVGEITSAQAPIPSEPMEVIMSNAVGTAASSGFHTAINSTTPASMPMQIGDVQLYQLPGSGETVTGANVTAGATPPPVTTPPATTPPATTPPATTPPAIQPAVTKDTASPGTGVEHVGDKVSLTLGFNEAVTVTGKPTLTLNDGSTATYVSGSGTNALIFQTTVASTNTATSALAVTGVNLASGASIKDASGLSANLSGAAKTFSGLQISPTAVSTPPVTTPPVTTPPGTGASGGVTPPKIPVLSVADHSLSVSPGHSVSLGIGVTVPNKGDAVTVHVAGLPRYETITDNLDHKTFSGSSISLTAAEVNSGLTLTSHYRGHGDPTATLSVTATDSTGKPVTSAAQTITVKDPPAAVASSGTSSGNTTKPVTSPTSSKPGTSVTSSDPDKSSGHHGHHGFHNLAQWFSHHPDFAPVANTLSEAGASKSAATPKVGTATDSVASAGAKSFALFNQMMAGDFGHDSHFAQVATASPTSLHQSSPSLTKPLH